MDAIKTVNPTIWVFAIMLVGWCIVQAALFLRLALRFNKKHNIYSKDDLKTCVKTGLIAAIGPGINTVFLGISMLALLGSGITFMRLGVIGAPMFELNMAQYSASMVGFNIGTDTLTPSILTFMIYAMCSGTAIYVLAPIFTLRPLEMAGRKKDGNPKSGILMKILPSAGITILFALAYDYVAAGAASATAYFVAFGIGLGIYMLVGKGHKNLAAWALLFASIGGVTAAQIVTSMMG